jgi:PAS domain S-box-containing protein/putative nucleotidyltransferase with HDIG domain
MPKQTDSTTLILLVEDEPGHAELVRRAFEKSAPEVRLVVATSLAEARACAGKSVPAPSMIIADWRLPDGHGVDLLDPGATLQPCPVIIMTSYGNERLAVEAMRAGALDYVVKSEATLADLPHTARRALREWKARADRARMASALRESEQRLRTLVANAPVILFSTDSLGELTLFEGKGLALLGITPGQVEGRSIFDVWHDSPAALGMVRRALSGSAEKTLVDMGSYSFETSLAPLRNVAGEVTGMIGVAIDVTERERAEQRLREAGQELAEAYDATLEGWSRALELREHETAGHSQRVVDLTLRLAQALGVGGSDLVHMRRGALLHDIGKMAVPDRILLKPEPLDPEEWVTMRQHPLYAAEMLRSIPYLRPALDIPYCHHERWDGSGYPRGLAGEQIPVAARIFAVADVWDALTSDRPYRPPWPERDARRYLRSEAGSHLDPRIVEVFLAVIFPKQGTDEA